MIDLHTRHERCGHAHGTLDAYAAAAATRGVAILGRSDNAPLFASHDDHSAPGTQMAISAFNGYLAECRAVRERFAAEVDIRIGAEADYLPGTEAVYRAQLARDDLDYTIGSVHTVYGHHIYRPSERPEDLDALKVFAPAPEHDDIARAVTTSLDATADSGIVVEVNTAGLRKCGELFPAPALIARLHRRGVRFTFGSDAHHPNEVAYEWGYAMELLTGLGVRELVTFVKREAHSFSLAC